MSDQNPKELLSKIEDKELRDQLSQEFDALSGSTLRQQVEELQSQVKDHKQQARTRAFRDAGFDPEQGHGLALAKLYDGEADPEKIREAANQYGFQPGTGSAESQTETATGPTGEEALAQLNSGSIPPRDPSADDRMKKAQAEGDWTTFDRLAADKLAQMTT